MSLLSEEELSKQLETTLFEAGQAQSRSKQLDSQLGEAQRRATDLKKEEEDLTKWKADLFEKVRRVMKIDYRSPAPTNHSACHRCQSVPPWMGGPPPPCDED
eukprot:SAG25_NODE_2272_length_1762_cov_3.666867_2_plen_102_part_00